MLVHRGKLIYFIGFKQHFAKLYVKFLTFSLIINCILYFFSSYIFATQRTQETIYDHLVLFINRKNLFTLRFLFGMSPYEPAFKVRIFPSDFEYILNWSKWIFVVEVSF